MTINTRGFVCVCCVIVCVCIICCVFVSLYQSLPLVLSIIQVLKESIGGTSYTNVGFVIILEWFCLLHCCLLSSRVSRGSALSLPWLSLWKTLTTSLCSALLFFSFVFFPPPPPSGLFCRSLSLSVSLPVCLSVFWLRSDSYKKVAFHEEQIQGQRQGQGHLPALHV